MFKDILPTFKEKYNRDGKDRLITDDYILKSGVYILIGDNYKESMIISGNKKNLESEKMHPLYKKICELDYNSSLLTMNKPIDPTKQIHSNNYYSFFFKIENKEKINKNVIDGYYKILKNPHLKYTKSLQKQMYKSVEEKLGLVEIEKIEKIQNYINENIDNIINECSIEKGYVKIFFDAPIEEYLKEGNRYFLSNIYNVVDYNTLINDELYGIPGVNLGCNSDKPNLKFRGGAPFLLSLEDALMQKKLSDYLSNQAANQKYNIYISKDDIESKSNKEEIETNFQGIYLRVQKVKELEIIDYSVISNFEPILENFKLKDYVFKELKNHKFTQRDIRELKKLELLIDETYFNSFLINSYFSEPKKLSNPTIKQALMNNKEALFTWFYKGDSSRFKSVYKKFTLDLIYDAVERNNFIRAIDRFNLRMSLMKYFGGTVVDFYQLKKDLLNKIKTEEEFKFSSDEEYYIGVGQLASYMTKQSQASEKTFSLGMPIIKAKHKNIIDTELRRLMHKYGYKIYESNNKFKKLYVATLNYNPTSLNQDATLAGYMMDNIMFIKKDDTTKEEK